MKQPVAKNPLSPQKKDRERGSNDLLTRARSLRQHATEAERVLWKHLREHRLEGYKFRRQVVIEPYIVDFVCIDAKLIVEADGGQHAEQLEYDAQRTARLEAMGYRIMRFWNHEILVDLHDVLEQIRSALIETPSPQPSPGGRGGQVGGN